MTTRATVALRHLLEGPEDAPVFVLSNSLGTTPGLVSAPTLVIVGADDSAAPPDRAESIRDSIPNASLEVVSGRRPPRQHRAARSQRACYSRSSESNRKGGEMSPGESTHERGMKVRREVLGDDHVDAAIGRTTDFTADFQDLITRYAWGEIWAREGLDRRMRSAITLSALVALGRLEELEMHVRAALRNGLGVDEIREVLLQSAIYCGVPAANSAFAVAQRVLSEGDKSQGRR